MMARRRFPGRWAHIDEIGGDRGRGAHSSVIPPVPISPRCSRWIRAGSATIARGLHSVIGLAGPYDFLPLTDPVLQVILERNPTLLVRQPITFADGSGAAIPVDQRSRRPNGAAGRFDASCGTAFANVAAMAVEKSCRVSGTSA